MTPMIRPARLQDVAGLVPMVTNLAAHHGDVARLDAEQITFLCFGPRPWATLLVAETGGALVGYCALIRKLQLQYALRIMDVSHLFVCADRRGQGIGRALLDEACAVAKDHGCKAVTLGVQPGNPRAHGFYAQAGFEPRQWDSVQMVRTL